MRSDVFGIRRIANGQIRMLMLATCLLLSGCKVDVYTGLSEIDANGMLAVLLSNEIDAEKRVNGDQGVTLMVEQRDLARAIELLSANGLPREKQDSIGKVFAKNGIMSSPFEERVRYLYALGEEISKTLTQIEGVIAARVHVVLPDKPDLGVETAAPSAAVFIKYRRGIDLDFLTPQIRRLVSKAIEGVSYENVTVVLDEAAPPNSTGIAPPTLVAEPLLGIGIRASDEPLFWKLVIALGLVFFVLLAASGVFAGRLVRDTWAARRRRGDGDPVAERGE